MDDREAVRRRPGMYVGDTDGDGVQTMLFEVIGNSIDQHLAGRCTTVTVGIDRDGTFTVEDDGPGIAIDGSSSLPPAMDWLTRLSRTPTVDGHRPHAHVASGIGLFPVNALSEYFELVTVREGRRATFVFERGVPRGAPLVEPTDQRSGTRVRFRPDPEIFANRVVGFLDLARRLDDLSFVVPRLAVALAVHRVPPMTMRERVAAELGRPVEDVAHHAARREAASGPIDVEVAFAWTRILDDAPKPPVIHSFANLKRTSDEGTHVMGLRDALAERLDLPGSIALRDLIGAVTVVLADVIYGNPTKDRLDSPEARPAVRAAALAAFDAWAPTHAEQIAQLRERAGRARNDNSGNRRRRR